MGKKCNKTLMDVLRSYDKILYQWQKKKKIWE